VGDKMFEAAPIAISNNPTLIDLYNTPQKKHIKRTKTHEQQVIPQETPEQEFLKTYESLNVGNSNVQAKRKELGVFPFSVKSKLENIKLVKDVEKENGEVYSGFMYFIQ
jgi:hypothetical protein